LALSGVSATGEPSLYEAVLVAIRSQQRAWHQVQVRAPDSEVVIRTRSGYYASSR